jgi:hypothetical protein
LVNDIRMNILCNFRLVPIGKPKGSFQHEIDLCEQVLKEKVMKSLYSDHRISNTPSMQQELTLVNHSKGLMIRGSMGASHERYQGVS